MSLVNQKIPAINNLVVFHGTSANIKAFREEGIGLGGDANSALGVHATACPGEAAEYARMSCEHDGEENGKVLVLIYPFEKESSIHSGMEFFGIDEYGNKEADHHHFSEVRQRYLDDKIDLLNVEYGEEPVFVLMRPEQIKVIGSLTLNEADQLSEKIWDENLDRFDSQVLYRECQSLIKSRRLRTPDNLSP